jgi:hypothetical protein
MEPNGRKREVGQVLSVSQQLLDWLPEQHHLLKSLESSVSGHHLVAVVLLRLNRNDEWFRQLLNLRIIGRTPQPHSLVVRHCG